MDLIFVADSPARSQLLVNAAARAGHRVIRHTGFSDEASEYVATMRPQAVIFVSDEIDRNVLREMRAVTEKSPTPILVFTHDASDAAIDESVKAGASAYIVDCHDASRLNSLLRVSLTRFAEQQKLTAQLERTRLALQDRKIVEKAKGLIMQQKHLSEDQAYRTIRKLAMDQNRRLGEIAELIIAAPDVLA